MLKGDYDSVREPAADAVGEWVTSNETSLCLKAPGGGVPPDRHGVSLIDRNAIEVAIEAPRAREDLKVMGIENGGVELLESDDK